MPAIPRAASLGARLVLIFAAFTALAPLAGTAFAQDAESTVYIKCDTPDGKTTRGSGVIVSEDGRVLTAKHVAPSADYKCRGVVGTAADEPTRSLLRRTSSPDYDALLLYFVPKPGEKFRPVYVVNLEPDLQGRAIAAYGFPATGTGQVSVRSGTISTTTPNEGGMIETDALTTRGMSGGPVFLKDTPGGRALVGIVAGANFDPGAGNEADFAVLAADLLRKDFELLTLEDLVIERPEGGGNERTDDNGGDASAADGVIQLAGKWSGDAAEPGGFAFEVEMDIAPECTLAANCGWIAVPHVPCRGRLALVAESEDGFEFGVSAFDANSSPDCTPGAGEVVKPLPDGTLSYTATYSGARGILRRAGEPN